MASRRKYKAPRGYRDGGAVTTDDVAQVPEAGADAPLAPAPTEAVSSMSDPDAGAVRRALDANLRAEELRRQAPEPPRTADDAIERLPISEHKKRFLRDHAADVVNDPFMTQALRWHYGAALAAGVPDDSEEMNNALRAGLRFEMERRGNRGAAPITQEPSAHAAEQLSEEADAISRMMRAQDGTTPMQPGEDIKSSVHSLSAADIPPTEPRRRSMPVSAPVSREVPTASGQRRSNQQIVLTPEERDMARRSASWLPADEAERQYAFQKAKLQHMRSTGEYRRTTEEGG